jgi:hypothetical protein
LFNNTICITSPNPQFDYCTLQNYEIYSVTKIYSDNFEYFTGAGAGSFGFGGDSPVWEIIRNPSVKRFDVQLSNFTDWSFANSSYVPTSTTNELSLGVYNAIYTDLPSIVLTFPTNEGDYMLL